MVTDTFGVRTLLRPNGDGALAPRAPWQLFQLTMPVHCAAGEEVAITNLFFLPPSLAQPLEGAPLEEVLLLRDEMANVAWAIQRRLESPLEAGLDAADDIIGLAVEEPQSPMQVPVYRLASSLPAHWIPLLPVRTDGTGSEVCLARAAVLDLDGGHRIIRAQGDILQPSGESGPRLLIRDEEVPRAGAVVRRSYQAARWYDGRLFVWIGNRKSVGRGEGSGGLGFDALNL